MIRERGATCIANQRPKGWRTAAHRQKGAVMQLAIEQAARFVALRAMPCIVFVALTSLVTTAQGEDDLLVRLSWGTGADFVSREDRAELAKALLKEIGLLAHYLPNPKRSDAAWLSQERAEIAALPDDDAREARTKHLLSSPAQQHKQLYVALFQLQHELECIENPANLAAEMQCWAAVSMSLTDPFAWNEPIRILVRDGRLPKDIAKKADLMDAPYYGLTYQMYGNGVIARVLPPYLNGQTVAERRP